MKNTVYKLLLSSVCCLALSACATSFHEEARNEPVAEIEMADNAIINDDAEEVTIATTPKSISKKLAKKEDDERFEVASINDSTLSEMRGGFVSVGGLKINFGFSSMTSVNGTPISSLNLSSSALNGKIPANIQQIMQNGNGNQAAVTSSNAPITILTTVQNTLNNQTINNQNVLDVTVNNLAAYRNLQTSLIARFGVGR